jgi:hypothetical protein
MKTYTCRCWKCYEKYLKENIVKKKESCMEAKIQEMLTNFRKNHKIDYKNPYYLISQL